MADQALPQLGRLTIQCTICLEIFKRPKVLTCGHSFCRECLVQMIRVGRGSFNCPVCREEHHVGREGVDELRDNYALGSIVDSLQITLGNQAAPEDAPAAVLAAAANAPPTPQRRSFFGRVARPKPAPTKTEPKKDQKEKGEVPTCVRHPGKKLEACCEQCEDSVCGECISTKCRPQKHKCVSIKEKADMIRIRLKLLLLGAAFSNLKDNMTLGQGLVEGGKVVGQAEKVRGKILEAHERALEFADQRKKQYTEIIEQSMAENPEVNTVNLQMLQRQFARLEEVWKNYRGATTADLGRESMQDIVGNVRQVVTNTRKVIAEVQPPGSHFEFIGYPPDGSVGELVYDQSNTIGVLSLSGGRLIIARDDRRIAGVCIGEVYQDKPADVKWLFTLKPANYIAQVIFCTLSLGSGSTLPEAEQHILIAVGQEIFVIDVNSSKYPESESQCPAKGILTVCPKSMPKNATITGIDWYPVPLQDGSYGFSTEFVIYTTDQSHDLTVVSTSTRLNVKVISLSIFLSLIRCHVIDNDVAILVRKSSDAKVLMINPNGTIKHTFAAPAAKEDANPTLLCWVENPMLMAAVLWVPVKSKGWEIVLYNARTGSVEKTIHGTGVTPTGLDGLVPDKIVMCFNDGGVRICASSARQGIGLPRNRSSIR